jgi:hypothetical protein
MHRKIRKGPYFMNSTSSGEYLKKICFMPRPNYKKENFDVS